MARRVEPRLEMTEADLLDALRSAHREHAPRPVGFYTITELAEKGGESVRTLRAQMAKLKAQGRVESAKVWIEGSDGRITPVTAYKLKAA